MDFWRVLYRGATALFIVLLALGLLSVFLPKFRENAGIERKGTAIEEDIHAKEKAIKDIKNQRERFESDPTFVENIAREELGKAKPGETIVKFSEPKAESNNTSQR